MSGADKNLARLGLIAALMGAVCVIAWIVALWRELGDVGYGGQALDVDFAVFWGAAKLALAEGPLIPFDMDRLNEARALPPDVDTFPMLWLYPPGWLVLMLPFGTLPFFWAWLLFGLISALILGLALSRPAREIPGVWPLMMASPAVLVTLALGQNSLIFAGLLVLALEALRREQHILAGLIIALMTLKPQLGLAIPVALLAGCYWRVILWAAVGATVIVASSLIWPGLSYWPAFFDGLQSGSDLIRDSALVAMMSSGYGTAVMAGIERGSALNVQFVISLIAAAGLFWLWMSRASFDLKASGLAFAILLVSPYAIYYELVFALVGCFYLSRADALRNRWTGGFVVLVWAAPLIGFALLQGPGFAFAAPLIAVGFGLVLFRIPRNRTT